MKIAITLLAALVVSSPALSQTEARGQRVMAMADTDGNRAVSLEEFEALRLRQFERADGNGDKILSAEEMATMQQGRQGRRTGAPAPDPTRLDVDGDGRVGFEEFEAGGRTAFARLDQNSDGRIDQNDRRQ